MAGRQEVSYVYRNIQEEVDRADPTRLSAPRLAFPGTRPQLVIPDLPGRTYGWAKDIQEDNE